MEGPPQFTAKTLDDYLEHMSKPVFQAGQPVPEWNAWAKERGLLPTAKPKARETAVSRSRG